MRHPEQFGGNVARRVPAVLGIFRKAARNDSLERGRRERDQLLDGSRLRRQDRRHDARRCLPLEGAVARDQLIKDAAKGEDVGAGIDVTRFDLLRRHVLGRADDGVCASEQRDCRLLGRRAWRRSHAGGRRRQLGESEVEELDALLGDEDIGRLEIAMDDALAVRRVECLADLDAVGDRLFDRHRPGDRLALDELHHQVAAAFVLADIKQRADVRMIERRDRMRLALEALREWTLQRLDGDVTIEPHVEGAVDVPPCLPIRPLP